MLYCIDIRCDILSTPSNGGMSCSSGRVGVGYEGDTCSFTCNTGYKLTGSGKSTTCQRNGSWSGNHIVCTGRFIYVLQCTMYVGTPCEYGSPII